MQQKDKQFSLVFLLLEWDVTGGGWTAVAETKSILHKMGVKFRTLSHVLPLHLRQITGDWFSC